MNPRIQLMAGVAAVVLLIAAGFLAGRSARPDATAGYTFEVDAAVYEATAPSAGLTKGGFSGFGETAGLSGTTMFGGFVKSISPNQLVIEAPDGTLTTVRLANPSRVRRIEATDRGAIRPGANVVILHKPDSSDADAVLVLEVP